MTYQESCHCGSIAFEVEGRIEQAMSCNCSICSRKGSLMWFVPAGHLTLRTPQDENFGTYVFNQHVIRHRFCKNCGIHPYGEGTDPKGQAMAAINIRCLEGIDIDAIPVTRYDGRSA
ncbi:Glutathione-dependent formaldehyde-activating GFA [Burkholderiales bacterium 8X]|nr:Glutathione-dependent formaldehyde-activating GFA [Burkholderiales bacterium 8X]